MTQEPGYRRKFGGARPDTTARNHLLSRDNFESLIGQPRHALSLIAKVGSNRFTAGKIGGQCQSH